MSVVVMLTELFRSYLFESPILIVTAAALFLIVSRGLSGVNRRRFAIGGFSLILATGLALPLVRTVSIALLGSGDASQMMWLFVVLAVVGSLLHAIGLGLLFAALRTND